MPEQKKLIQFKNIVKSFEDGQVVLKGVSLDIYEKEFVPLLGPSGCGKSTLLRCVNALEEIQGGSVTLEGQGDPDKFLELFAMIQRSDYVRITDIRQKDLPPDPWERGFSVRGY